MSVGAEILLVVLILLGAGFVLVTLGRRREERLRTMGIYPPEGQETQADVDRLIQMRLKIEAIKLFRKMHGVGLKEAKEAVEKREREIGVK